MRMSYYYGNGCKDIDRNALEYGRYIVFRDYSFSFWHHGRYHYVSPSEYGSCQLCKKSRDVLEFYMDMIEEDLASYHDVMQFLVNDDIDCYDFLINLSYYVELREIDIDRPVTMSDWFASFYNLFKLDHDKYWEVEKYLCTYWEQDILYCDGINNTDVVSKLQMSDGSVLGKCNVTDTYYSIK